MKVLPVFGILLAATALVTPARAADMKTLVVAEPVHGVGYLPLYIAVDDGYFAKLGLNVKIMTV